MTRRALLELLAGSIEMVFLPESIFIFFLIFFFSKPLIGLVDYPDDEEEEDLEDDNTSSSPAKRVRLSSS